LEYPLCPKIAVGTSVKLVATGTGNDGTFFSTWSGGCAAFDVMGIPMNACCGFQGWFLTGAFPFGFVCVKIDGSTVIFKSTVPSDPAMYVFSLADGKSLATASHPSPTHAKKACKWEGSVVEFCTSCCTAVAEQNHVRHCLHPSDSRETCTRGNQRAALPMCSTCPDYTPSDTP